MTVSNQATAHPRSHHGNTPAAWTVVVLITIAFTVGTLAVVLANWIMFAIGAALIPIALIVGKAMQAAGLGQYPRS